MQQRRWWLGPVVGRTVLAGTLVFAVAACGDDDDVDDPDQIENEVEDEVDEVENELEDEADEIEAEADEVEAELDEVEDELQE